MTTYIIVEELGPTYSVVLPRDGESLEGKPTIELTDAEYKEFADTQDVWWAWNERLRLKREHG